MTWYINKEGIYYRDWLQVMRELRRQMGDSEQPRNKPHRKALPAQGWRGLGGSGVI